MNEYLAAAETIAREAGEILRAGYGRAKQIDFKGAVDLVTEFDTASERHIVQRLGAAFPRHILRAEEGGLINGSADGDYEWLIDPLDGTTNYAHAFPVFAVSLALVRRGRVVVGVVYDPLRDELYSAEADAGATLNGRRIRVSSTADLGASLLATGFPYDVRTNPDSNLDHHAHFAVRAQGIRRAGAAALDLAWTACGRLDGFWELRLNPWDLAAGALIVLEAGGRVTDIHGGDDWLRFPSIVASNGRIHAAMLAVIEQGESAALPGSLSAVQAQR